MRRGRFDLAVIALAPLVACHAPPAPLPHDGLVVADQAAPRSAAAAGGTTAAPRVVVPSAAAAAGAAGASANEATSNSPAPGASAGGHEAGASGAMSAPLAPAAMLTAGASASGTCGNRIPEAGESCDGNCPSSCDDHDPCTADMSAGTAAQCSFRCTPTPITAAQSGDGCCPPRANANTDSDCAAVCGNGIVEASETCDGSCPTSCSGASVCMRRMLVGAATQCTAECVLMRITEAANADGCCPPSANANIDTDCEPYCGNKVQEAGESCDGDWPTSENCYWRSGCVRPVLSGAASLCSAQCEMTMITTAANGDGCCPQGANANSDSDCPAVCGNGVIELGEQCDGGCPENDLQCRDDDPCTTEHLVGSGCARQCRAAREATSCRTVPSGWSLGTMSSGSCPQGLRLPARPAGAEWHDLALVQRGPFRTVHGWRPLRARRGAGQLTDLVFDAVGPADVSPTNVGAHLRQRRQHRHGVLRRPLSSRERPPTPTRSGHELDAPSGHRAVGHVIHDHDPRGPALAARATQPAEDGAQLQRIVAAGERAEPQHHRPLAPWMAPEGQHAGAQVADPRLEEPGARCRPLNPSLAGRAQRHTRSNTARSRPIISP